MISSNFVLINNEGHAAEYIKEHAHPGDHVLIENWVGIWKMVECIGRSDLDLYFWSDPQAIEIQDQIAKTTSLVEAFFQTFTPPQIEQIDVHKLVRKLFSIPPEFFSPENTHTQFIKKVEMTLIQSYFSNAMFHQNEALKKVLLMKRDKQTFVIIHPDHMHANLSKYGDKLAKDLTQFFSDRLINVIHT